MTDLPSGWVSTTLKEIAEWSSGGTPSRKRSDYFGGGIPWVKTGELTGKYIRETEESLSELGLKNSSAKIFAKGSVGIAMYGATIGKVSIWGIEASTNQACAVAQPIDGVASSEFLYHFLRSEKAALIKEGKGGAQPNISLGLLKEWPIPLPPLNEQRRIVEKIEAMFDEIDKGVESLQTARTALGLYRQSLLKSAFEGRLTADWRAQNADKLESPETLLARIKKERETRYKAALDTWQEALAKWRAGAEKGKKPTKPKRQAEFEFQAQENSSLWPTVRVEATLRAPLINGRSVKDKAGGFPVLRLTALKNGKIALSENKEGNWTEDEARPFLVEHEDIFLARGNGSKKLVGIGGRVMEKPMPVAFPDTMIRVRLDTSAVRPDFFLLAWNSWTVRSQIEEAARTTAGIYKINQDHVSGFTLPLPCLAEQAEITRILDARLEAADALEAEIDAALTRADALRQSILKKAFSGRLVPQDPEDEPASVLLERIKAERAKAPKSKRRKVRA
ncbi:restriction endonuclease subunit S [Paracoccus seriniphilus]|uniref:Type I restriction enzyme, S subunit n=1 Tax=Paracoccus seriniphilus TaxID=184748 RepID=A0A239Q3E9_9RHOB|nr:restriction endonuclease subunit S [Paracoccus seriniphilus]WCR14012.1 restriction endonuclease subunit S [Paracoccus seriniphilus]SNT76838.1 type I restriction enzyme, S subunit [Paracoccus seriniphilus]